MEARRKPGPKRIEDRPTKRNSTYRDSHVQRAELACLVGMTDHELGVLFGVTEATINNWKNAHPEFAEALTAGKTLADERVVRSLYHSAIGYTYDSEEIFLRAAPKKTVKGKDGKKRTTGGGSEVIRVKVTKHVPPDTTAGIFWLKNRRSAEWRDVHKHEVGKPGEFDDLTQEQLRASILEDLAKLGIQVPQQPPMIEGRVEEVVESDAGPLDPPAGIAPKPSKIKPKSAPK